MMKRNVLFALLLATAPLAFVHAQQMVPEFTGLQPMDVSQYVDPATGDFNFQTLLLEIPGSQGSYPLILNYRAGIGLNQSASWVGLGFNLEPGAIYRSVSQVPDDYRRNKITVKEYDPGEETREDIPLLFVKHLRDYSQGMRNIITTMAQATGVGPEGLDVRTFLNPATPIVAYSEGRQAIYDFGQMALSNQLESFISNPPPFSPDPISLGMYVLGTFTTYPKVGKTGFSSWDYTIVDEVETEKFLFFPIDKDKVFKWSLNKTTDQNAYGFLYEHDKIKYLAQQSKGYFSPTFSDGSVPELYSYNKPQVYDNNRSYDSANITSDYFQLADTSRFENLHPMFSAPDAYSISSPMLSGELMPVRFDNVSISSSNLSNRYHDKRIATYTYALPTTERTQRPGFVLNQQSNQFSFFSEAIRQGDQALQYEIGSLADNTGSKALKFLPQASSLSGEVPAREGYDGAGTLKQAAQVEWYTNEEISEGAAYEQGFINYTANRGRGFQDVGDSPTKSPFPPKGIGGFTVVNKNGMRFHFALPVYERELVHHNERYNEESESTYNMTTTFSYPYAKKWLLTAITGSDFVDDGSLPGYIDDFDHGYFVKFDYGKYSSDSYWRSPEQGNSYLPADTAFLAHSTGREQQYFLNAITTSTHTALFVKERRRDYQVDTTGAVGNWLALKEVILLSNEDYRQLWDLKGRQWDSLNDYNSDFSSNVLKYEDIYAHNEIDSLVRAKALRKIAFNYSYNLAPQAPNPAQGRLTLQSIKLYGKLHTPVMREFAFDYDFNPNYHALSYDAWGLYKKNQDKGSDAHLVEDIHAGRAWSLTGITTPNQQHITVDYERDTYEHVAHYDTDSVKYGGNLRVATISNQDLVSGITSRYKFAYQGGVATSEPAFSLGKSYNLSSIYRYPQMQVTYRETEKKQVAGDSFLFKDVITFGTMDSSIIQIDTLAFQRHVSISPPDSSGSTYYGQQLNEAVYHVQYRTERLGQPQRRAIYDTNNQLIRETTYQYEDSPLGHLSQAAHLLDHTYRNYTKVPTESNQSDYRMTYRFINTVSSYIPQRLSSVTAKDHTTNTVSKSRFLDHDFYTGESLKTVTDDAYGNRVVSEKVPAFRKITGMGLAVDGGTNQLTVPAATYAYQLATTQPLDSLSDDDLTPVALLGAITQQWNPYQQTVWRPQQRYRWVGSQALRPDGTHSYDDFASQSFDWDAASQPNGWEPQGKALTYNPNGIPLLSEDINGQAVANLADPEEERVIASAIYARPEEIAFSGAEYYARFGDTEGRVTKGSGVPSEARAHTGDYSLLLPSGSEGFAVTLKKSEGADLTRPYRASVWVYMPGTTESQTEMDYVEFFYSINGSEQGGVSPKFQQDKSKSWYRLTLNIVPPAGTNEITVACRNNALRAIYLDDFRMHPLEASMTSYVYDKASDEITHVLDPENFYVQYDYDVLGNRISTKKEFYYTVDQVVNRTKIHYATPNR